MNTTKDIELKIHKFEGIKKIVISMKSIASLNLQKAQHLIDSIREYESQINETLKGILSYYPDINLSFAKGKKAVIVYGSDQGLCGLFNEKLANFVQTEFKEKEDFYGFIVIGKKLDDFITDNKIKTFPAPIDYGSIYSYATNLMEFLSDLYISNQINEIYLSYNQFVGIGKFKTVIKKVIPFEIKRKNIYEYPPIVDINPIEILSSSIIEYIYSNVFRAYIESFISENGVRMMNMNNASKSIEKSINKLEIEKNYFRQEEITNEIEEIISAYKVLVGEK
ncbi:F0F1 ATP synthase subunit gamma [Hydrogenothermus marinus]|uniref:ATP synthase F1 gamma subunit n=1 Tax=Hydrogenothermus marinus TaxID=133270 RepID=A0A3M0BKY7_9AQUI|nr:FoF1 ATP synthase subunit gamma [Hydrogenothermus marinus]RMA97236.1 ATP synthase F1 gamma subunit [Hydrogenothermus marinus]